MVNFFLMGMDNGSLDFGEKGEQTGRRRKQIKSNKRPIHTVNRKWYMNSIFCLSGHRVEQGVAPQDCVL